MGHIELKRVSLDFEWDLHKVWEGYINPFRSLECTACHGSGYNPETQKIADSYYSHSSPTGVGWTHNITQDEVQALIDAGRLMDFTRTPRNEQQRRDVEKKIAEGGNSWLPYDNGYIPTAEEINEWSKRGMGHDGINRWILIEARAKRLGVYGSCPKCGGEGSYFASPETEKRYNAWESYDPPAGEGFQLWETCSEGSPVSPVFKTAEGLADWCAENATVFGTEKTSRENWLRMFSEENGCDAGSMVIGTAGYFGTAINKPGRVE